MNKEETLLQNRIRLALSDYGITIRQQSGRFRTLDGLRIVDIGIDGISDLQFIGDDGTVAFLEVKTAKGKPSKDQKNYIEQMHQRGIRAGVVRSVDEALELIGKGISND